MIVAIIFLFILVMILFLLVFRANRKLYDLEFQIMVLSKHKRRRDISSAPPA